MHFFEFRINKKSICIYIKKFYLGVCNKIKDAREDKSRKLRSLALSYRRQLQSDIHIVFQWKYTTCN